MSETMTRNIIQNEVSYLVKKHGFDGMVARMTDKYKLTTGKTKDNTREGKVYGMNIMIVNGKHNNKHFRKVMTGDGKNTIFAI
jgi:hypothetical protein